MGHSTFYKNTTFALRAAAIITTNSLKRKRNALLGLANILAFPAAFAAVFVSMTRAAYRIRRKDYRAYCKVVLAPYSELRESAARMTA